MKLSGWCSPCKPGDNDHEKCQERLDKGQLTRCDCPGHPTEKVDVTRHELKRGYW